MAIYKIEADDPKEVLDRLMAIGTGGGAVLSDALDPFRPPTRSPSACPATR
jgi:hypothetical protein